MTKHLKICQQQQEQRKVVSDTTTKKQNLQKMKLFHIIVEGRYSPKYWMHLEIPSTATLRDLDDFLRDTWLECCGHLSAFTIEGERYVSYPDKEFDDKSMNISLNKILDVGMKFHHEYDFGTTTELALKVISERELEISRKTIQLLARNEPPSINCDSCGKIATVICSECIYEGKGWLCDECASKHECDEEMQMPVVNSPRVGMCGYTG